MTITQVAMYGSIRRPSGRFRLEMCAPRFMAQQRTRATAQARRNGATHSFLWLLQLHPHRRNPWAKYGLPSGYLTDCHGKWPIEIDALPINSMVIFHGKLLVIARWSFGNFEEPPPWQWICSSFFHRFFPMKNWPWLRSSCRKS